MSSGREISPDHETFDSRTDLVPLWSGRARLDVVDEADEQVGLNSGDLVKVESYRKGRAPAEGGVLTITFFIA